MFCDLISKKFHCGLMPRKQAITFNELKKVFWNNYFHPVARCHYGWIGFEKAKTTLCRVENWT